MAKQFPEQDKTLYRWKLTEDKRILKHSISRWEIKTFGMGVNKHEEIVFRIGDNSSVSYAKVGDLDRLTHNRYYSFTDDDEKVKQLFLDTFMQKVVDAQNELDRNMRILEEFKKNNL